MIRRKTASVFVCALSDDLDPSLPFLRGMRVHSSSILFVA
jgi:hypothetical protein